jgi:hypothetical protein
VHEPIHVPPRRVRPPYDVPDPELSLAHIVDTTRWRVAVKEDRLAALLEPLAGLEVTDYEQRALTWLAGWETSTVAVIAGLLWRCREAGPQPSSPDGGAGW